MTRILLVDDHPVVRHGIRQVLADGMKPVTIGEASNAEAALISIREVPWDVVVLDVTLPGKSGLDLLKDIRRERPSLPVLVLSMHPAVQFARRAISAGAAGYLTKESAPTELVRAVEEVRRGRKYLGTSTDRDVSSPTDSLSDREYQVFRMLGSGLTISQIAAALRLSVKTISTYRARVLEKLQMRSNAELMRYAIENRLLDS
jgi:DNA-binding NarL/FixJ family response regulator